MKRININERQYKLIIESGAYQVSSIGDTVETYYRGTDVPCDISDFGIDKNIIPPGLLITLIMQ